MWRAAEGVSKMTAKHLISLILFSTEKPPAKLA
jgi:hypothetical protein